MTATKHFTAALIVAFIAACSGPEYESAIVADGRPGTIVSFRYEQPVGGDEVSGWLQAHPTTEPRSLPGGASVVYSSLGLSSPGQISGQLLVHIPEDAEGDIDFMLSAVASGSSVMTGTSRTYRSREIPVTIRVSGAPPQDSPPSLEGRWQADGWTWTFDEREGWPVQTRSPDGDELSFPYRVYPDGHGRWYLVSTRSRDVAYWLQIDGFGLHVDHPSAEFTPYRVFERD